MTLPAQPARHASASPTFVSMFYRVIDAQVFALWRATCRLCSWRGPVYRSPIGSPDQLAGQEVPGEPFDLPTVSGPHGSDSPPRLAAQDADHHRRQVHRYSP